MTLLLQIVLGVGFVIAAYIAWHYCEMTGHRRSLDD